MQLFYADFFCSLLPPEKASHQLQLQVCLKYGSTRASYGTHIVLEEMARNARKPYLIYNYICQKLWETAEWTRLKGQCTHLDALKIIIWKLFKSQHLHHRCRDIGLCITTGATWIKTSFTCSPIYIHPPTERPSTLLSPSLWTPPLFPIHLMSLMCLNLTSLFVAVM